MPVVSAPWLPSEFVELTSARMLRAPIPQFFYAQMIYMADIQAQLRVDPSAFEWVSGRGIPGDAGGAPVTPDYEQMKLMLADPIRSGAVVVADELATAPGSVVKLNRPVFSGGGYSLSARTVGAGQTISVTPISLTGEQVPIEILRLSGPYASGGSSVQPYGLDRFAAMQSVHSLAERVGKHMQYDRDRLLDTVIGGLIDSPASGGILYPGDPNSTLSSDSSAFTTNVNGDRPFDLETLLRMKAYLQVNNIPTFDDGMYRCTVTPQQAQQLQLDPQFRSYAKESESTNPLKLAFLANIGNEIEVYRCNTNTIDSSTVSGVNINHAVMFGRDIIGRVRDKEGCRIMLSSDDNYGETAKAIWLSYEGFSLLDNRFVVAAHSN